ncbi:MAG: hypothetical protein HRF46_00855 [Acidobacteriota bacterium]
MVASGATAMIHLSTSGWRGVVGQDLTFRNVRLLLEATVQVLRRRRLAGEVVVSYDTRLLSEKFAQEAVSVFTHHGFSTVASERDLPSPCLAWAVRERGAVLGVTFTASHNPAEYNGVKLYVSSGAPAPLELCEEVQGQALALQDSPEPFYVPQRELRQRATLMEGYLGALEREVDWDAIRASGLKVAVDPLYGTSREFLDRVLLAHGVPTVALHGTKDPYFGGYAPECTPANLEGLRELVRTSGAHLGLATDGDADRFGIVNHACRAVAPSVAIALLVDYLVRRRGVGGGVARTTGTSRLVDRIAARHGRELVETPVGFHFLAQEMLSGRVGVAVEESAGVGIATHLPERDGILAALLTAEMVAVEGATIPELIRRLYERYGALFFRRVQVPFTEKNRTAFRRLLRQRRIVLLGQPVRRIEVTDGLLLAVSEDAWVLLRQATTEPRLRVYAEAPTTGELRALVREARRLLASTENGR